MQLKEVLDGLTVLSVRADLTREITGVSYDSRRVEAGHVFAAIPGEETDGSRYAAQAARRGAVCVLCQRPLEGLPHVVVPSARQALAVAGTNWYGWPARQLRVIGVTGTNGKTSTAFFLRHILRACLRTEAGLVGTVENLVGDKVIPARRTTPESADLQALLRQMADGGCTHAVMEVSSHALSLDRVYGIPFAVGIFTNLTQDHLDFHGTMENYCGAKARLFRQCEAAVCNRDDPWCGRVLHGSACRRIYYGVDSPADLRAEDLRLTDAGVSYRAVTETERTAVHVPIPGRFTVSNSLAALGAALALGIPLKDGAAALADVPPVRGRMEPVDTGGRDFRVLIDYAHTPDALENVLTAVKSFARGRVFAVFGCGGDRDRTKRPLMGAAAARLADVAVVTSDNPRTEDPLTIIGEIQAGMDGGQNAVVIPDRSEAIRWALAHAGRGDVVVLCGKGHESYQEIGRERRHLDEREIVRAYFKNR